MEQQKFDAMKNVMKKNRLTEKYEYFKIPFLASVLYLKNNKIIKATAILLKS